jgi:hypothetical protein
MHTLSTLFVYCGLQLVVLVLNEQHALYDSVSLLSSLLQHAVMCGCSGSMHKQERVAEVKLVMMELMR